MKNQKSERNMSAYVDAYQSIPFEPIQIKFRRKLVLEEINKVSPKTLLEVGCGNKPLFLDLPNDLQVTVVEPAAEFAKQAMDYSSDYVNVKVINEFLEDVMFENATFDMIVLSCVLHEVENPRSMLLSLKKLCHQGSVLHINVPNASSFHRCLAVSMGIIPSVHVKSDMQTNMQQNSKVYSMDTLTTEVQELGFEKIDSGSIFVKPFTHAQMQLLVDSGFITPEMLNGFANLAKMIPDIGSEIWINVRSL